MVSMQPQGAHQCSHSTWCHGCCQAVWYCHAIWCCHCSCCAACYSNHSIVLYDAMVVVAVITLHDWTAKEEVSKKKINENICMSRWWACSCGGHSNMVCVTKAHKEDGDAVYASAGTRQGGGRSALLCITTIITVRLVGPRRPLREKAGVSISREGRVWV